MQRGSDMNSQALIDTARMLVAGDKGLLAMDESIPTCNKRFARLGIPQTEEARRAYRALIVSTPGLGECISGAILFDETLRQRKNDGTPLIKAITDGGIIPGIKVDTGAKDMAGHPGEKVTEGLDGLRERLAEYSQMGARFAKWRAVIAIGDAYTDQPNHMAAVRSELHQNIQNTFNEAGVEIMSPHYANVRDGDQTTVPGSYLPKSYQAPAFRIFHQGDARHSTE